MSTFNLSSVRTLDRGTIDKKSGLGKPIGADRSSGTAPEIAKEYKVRILAPLGNGE